MSGTDGAPAPGLPGTQRPTVPGIAASADILKPPVAAWLVFWAGFAALDWYADRRGRSLSCATRALFRTNHPAGRAAFTVGLFGGAVVLHAHIVKRTT